MQLQHPTLFPHPPRSLRFYSGESSGVLDVALQLKGDLGNHKQGSQPMVGGQTVPQSIAILAKDSRSARRKTL